MKVGLSLRYTDPECGGGNTFESDVFAALCAAAAGSRHEFVVVGSDEDPPPAVRAAPRIGYVSCRQRVAERFRADPRGTATRAAAAVLRKLYRPGAPFRIDPDHARAIAAAVSASGIEMTWSLGPGCLFAGIPYIATVWDLQHRLQPWFPEVSADGVWESREELYSTTLRRAAFVLTGTEEGKSEIGRFYQVPAGRIRVLPLPTPTFAASAPPSADGEVLGRYGLRGGYLFYPSQFWPHKNHAALLRAARLLRERHGLSLPIVLTGSDQGNLAHVRALAGALGLSDALRLPGFVPRGDLPALYRNALALTFVSFFGPDNLPPLEAFALGCPVIASRVPGAAEQLGDAALLVDPRDEAAIAAAILSLRDAPELRRTLVERGLARAGRWTAGDYVGAVLGLLDEFEAVRRCWGAGAWEAAP